MFDRRTFLKLLASLGLAGIGTSAYGAYQLPSSAPLITPYRLTPRGWTQGLKLRIAALSDLHCGGVHMPLSRIATIVETTNALKPDLILLLGDYITSARRNVHDLLPEHWAPTLAKLSAPLGVF
ncbi:MAG: metallophosphoesterase, partial [Bosea sp. (in: a-proteobacteria)]